MSKLKTSHAFVQTMAASAACAALLATTAASAQDTPQIVTLPVQSAPPVPAGLKVTCLQGPNTLQSSPTCPAILYKDVVTWAFSYIDNRVSYGVVSYSQPGLTVLRNAEAPGARYVYKMTVNPTAQTVSIWGQSDAKVDVAWADLPAPPPPSLPEYAWYVAPTPPPNVIAAPSAPNKTICKGLDAQNHLWAGWWNGSACVGSLNGQQQLTTGNFEFLIPMVGTAQWPAFTGSPPANAINAGKTYQGQDQYLCSQNGYIGWINGSVCDVSAPSGPSSPAVALQGKMY